MNNPLPEIRNIEPLQLIGLRMTMSILQDKTGLLWGTFMKRRSELGDRPLGLRYSLQWLTPDFFNPFNPTREFEKWALVEWAPDMQEPEGMERFHLPAGEYAVFRYKAADMPANDFFNYIYAGWLPASGYVLSNRPHFEILPPGYRQGDPAAEEEIWIPISRNS